MLRAVLTREPVEVAAYASVLAPLGVEAVAMPVTRTAAPHDPDALAHALATGPFAAIVVASPRAAHELGRAIIAARLDPGDVAEIWAIGPATRRALAIAKLAAHHPADVRDGAELAHAMVAARPLRGTRVLVPRAEEGRTEAIAILRAAGAEIVDVIAYRTLAVAVDDPTVVEGRALLAAGGAAVCAVFSPSQVTALAAIAGPLDHVRTAFCAIGETTAAALRAAGIAAPGVAASPTPEGLARAIAALCSPAA